MENYFENPINWVLLSVFVYIVYQKIWPKTNSIDIKHPIVVELRDMTPKELSVYNGLDGNKIYLAAKGKIFDVSASPSFYGPGSMYENFAGRDASRGLAKNSFDISLLTDLDKPIDKLEDLTDEERQSLDDWFQFFSGKYNHVGNLVNPK